MRRLRVGVPDVEMEVVPSLQDNGDLIVDVQIENKTDKPLSFKTTLTPENLAPFGDSYWTRSPVALH